MLRYPTKGEPLHAAGANGNDVSADPTPSTPPSSSDDHLQQQAQPSTTPPRVADVCKYWVNSNGKCFRGAACPHFHPPLAALPRYRAAWVQRRAAERALASHLDGDTHDPLQDKTHKAARARVGWWDGNDWLVGGRGWIMGVV